MEVYYCRYNPKKIFDYVEVKSCQTLKLTKPSTYYLKIAALKLQTKDSIVILENNSLGDKTPEDIYSDIGK